MMSFRPHDERRKEMLRQGFNVRMIHMQRESHRITSIWYEYVGDGTDALQLAEPSDVVPDAPAKDDTPLGE